MPCLCLVPAPSAPPALSPLSPRDSAKNWAAASPRAHALLHALPRPRGPARVVGLATPTDVPFRLVTLTVGHHASSVLKDHRGTLGLTRDSRALAQGSPAVGLWVHPHRTVTPAHEDPELPSESGCRHHMTKGHTGTGARPGAWGVRRLSSANALLSPPGSAVPPFCHLGPLGFGLPQQGLLPSWPGSRRANMAPPLSGHLSTCSPLSLRTEMGSVRQGSPSGQGGGG